MAGHAYNFLLELKPDKSRDPLDAKESENRNVGHGRMLANPSGLSVGGDWGEPTDRGDASTRGRRSGPAPPTTSTLPSRTAEEVREIARLEAKQAMARVHAEQATARKEVSNSVSAALKRKAAQEVETTTKAKSRFLDAWESEGDDDDGGVGGGGDDDDGGGGGGGGGGGHDNDAANMQYGQ